MDFERAPGIWTQVGFTFWVGRVVTVLEEKNGWECVSRYDLYHLFSLGIETAKCCQCNSMTQKENKLNQRIKN